MGILSKIFHPSYVSKSGYKQHYNPNSPYVNADGYSPVHRDLGTKKSGHVLSSEEIVHHMDGNKLNNKRSNLKVVSKWEHHEIHKQQGQEIWGKKYSKKLN